MFSLPYPIVSAALIALPAFGQHETICFIGAGLRRPDMAL
jgi:hypothetical protein